MSQAAGQVNILIFLLKIKFSPCLSINFVMQGKCLFSDISRPDLMGGIYRYTIIPLVIHFNKFIRFDITTHLKHTIKLDKNEPKHCKVYNMACPPGEDSD